MFFLKISGFVSLETWTRSGQLFRNWRASIGFRDGIIETLIRAEFWQDQKMGATMLKDASSEAMPRLFSLARNVSDPTVRKAAIEAVPPEVANAPLAVSLGSRAKCGFEAVSRKLRNLLQLSR